MSDGPYKSLPLPRCWKKLAQRLENNAYSSTDVDETFHHALSMGFKDIPFEQVKNILLKNNLFERELINDLDKLKDFCAGSDIGIRFIDFVKIKYQKESMSANLQKKAWSLSLTPCIIRKTPAGVTLCLKPLTTGNISKPIPMAAYPAAPWSVRL